MTVMLYVKPQDPRKPLSYKGIFGFGIRAMSSQVITFLSFVLVESFCPWTKIPVFLCTVILFFFHIYFVAAI